MKKICVSVFGFCLIATINLMAMEIAKQPSTATQELGKSWQELMRIQNQLERLDNLQELSESPVLIDTIARLKTDKNRLITHIIYLLHTFPSSKK